MNGVLWRFEGDLCAGLSSSGSLIDNEMPWRHAQCGVDAEDEKGDRAEDIQPNRLYKRKLSSLELALNNIVC